MTRNNSDADSAGPIERRTEGFDKEHRENFMRALDPQGRGYAVCPGCMKYGTDNPNAKGYRGCKQPSCRVQVYNARL